MSEFTGSGNSSPSTVVTIKAPPEKDFFITNGPPWLESTCLVNLYALEVFYLALGLLLRTREDEPYC